MKIVMFELHLIHNLRCFILNLVDLRIDLWLYSSRTNILMQWLIRLSPNLISLRD